MILNASFIGTLHWRMAKYCHKQLKRVWVNCSRNICITVHFHREDAPVMSWCPCLYNFLWRMHIFHILTFYTIGPSEVHGLPLLTAFWSERSACAALRRVQAERIGPSGVHALPLGMRRQNVVAILNGVIFFPLTLLPRSLLFYQKEGS